MYLQIRQTLDQTYNQMVATANLFFSNMKMCIVVYISISYRLKLFLNVKIWIMK